MILLLQDDRGGRQPELHAGAAQSCGLRVQSGIDIIIVTHLSNILQVKTGLGEAMEGIGEELLEEYKKKEAK